MSEDNYADAMTSLGLPTGFGSYRSKQVKKETPKKVKVGPIGLNKKLNFGKKSIENDSNVGTESQLLKKRKLEDKKPVREDVKNDMENEDEDEDEDEDDLLDIAIDPDDIPSENQAILKGHTKAVTSISIDSSGSRCASGGRDGNLMLWDFSTMGKDFQSFKTIEVARGNPISSINFNNSNTFILISTSDPEPLLYDRDGKLISRYAKGDPYIRDQKKTKGHISSITTSLWHPYNDTLFTTASSDGTVRIWDLNTVKSQKEVIQLKPMKPSNQSTIHVTSLAYLPISGKMLLTGSSDGNIRIYSNNSYQKPSILIENAHKPASNITSAVIAKDGHTLVSRATDDTLKLWDIRNNKSFVNSICNLDTLFDETNIIFSPSEKYVITGTSVRKSNDVGYINVYNKFDFSLVNNVPTSNGSVIKLLWNTKINQLFSTLSSGNICAQYDHKSSIKGVVLGSNKKKKAKSRKTDEIDENPIIIVPALNSQQNKKKKALEPVGPLIKSSMNAHFLKDFRETAKKNLDTQLEKDTNDTTKDKKHPFFKLSGNK